MQQDHAGDGQDHVVLGAGPVGRAVADHLVRDGRAVTVVTRTGTHVPGTIAVAADVADVESAKGALAGANVVYQCAQPAYHRWTQDFPALQRSIVDAAAAAGAVLVAVENLYAYGQVDGPLTEELPLAPTTRKGAVRAELWRQLERAHRDGTVATVAARASDFYGPGVKDSMLGERFFGPLLAGRRPEVVGDPAARHTVTYVPDLAAAMVRLGGDPGAWGRAWHVPNAPTVSTGEIVAEAAAAAGQAPAMRIVPRWQLRLAGVFVPGAREVVEMLYEFEHDFVVDHSAYAERYPTETPTPLADGLAVTVAWYRSREAGGHCSA